MPSKCQMWLTYNGGTEKLRFPVLPENLNIQKGSQSKSVDIQGLGEVVIKQDPAAIVITFSSFFPAQPFPGVQFEDLTHPYDLKDKISAWQRGDRPVHFIVTGTTVNLFCVIDDFTYYEKGGDVETLHYTLSLREYRELKARQVKIENPAPKAATHGDAKSAAGQPTRVNINMPNSGPVPPKALVPPLTPTRTDNRAPEKTHTVEPGESLYTIAAKTLGDGGRYTEIASLNADAIKSPVLIAPGQMLRMPT